MKHDQAGVKATGLRSCLLVLLLSVSNSFAVDTVLFNGKVITVDSEFSIAEAIAITDGRIALVGSDREIRELADPDTTLIDLSGKTVVPGFIDTHPHMIHVGSGAANVVLAEVESIADILQLIADRVATTPEGEWIRTSSIGNPRNVRALPGALQEHRWPTRYDLDKVAPDNPVYIPTPWGGPKPAVLNSLALELLDISADTPAFDKGIEIIKDEHTGKPNGLIRGMHAYNWNPYYAKISTLVPQQPVASLADGVEQHVAAFNSRGLTAVYESHYLTEINIETIAYLLDRDRLNIRVKLAPELRGAQWQSSEAIEGWLTNLQAAAPVADSELAQMLGATLSSDGPVSFGKAMMNVPYWNMAGERAKGGWPTLSEETVIALTNAAHACQKMAVVHIETIDDARIAVNAGAEVLAHVWRDAGADVDFSADLAARGVVIATTLVTQDGFVDDQGGSALVADSRLQPWLSKKATAKLTTRHGGPVYADIDRFIEAAAGLVQAGVTLMAGTDVSAGTTSHGISMHRELELLVRAGLSPLETLKAATSNIAATFCTDDRGVIAPGKRADLLLVRGDPTVDIMASRDIVGVWRGGVEFNRELSQEEI